MKYGRERIILLLSLVLLCGIIFSTSCGPSVNIKIENHTDQVLTIYKAFGRLGAPGRVGDVAPDDYIQLDDLRSHSYFLFYAKNDKDELVFYRGYSMQELVENDFTVVMLPMLQGRDSSDNVTFD